ncbi:hypothetical protein CRUP_006778, partial [Coryphaenoides rupestris]
IDWSPRPRSPSPWASTSKTPRRRPTSSCDRLEPQASVTVSMGIDFKDSTQAANFQLCTKEDAFPVSIQPACSSGAALNKQVLFAGRTVSTGALVLVTVDRRGAAAAVVTVNTDKTVMASMLLRDLKAALLASAAASSSSSS